MLNYLRFELIDTDALPVEAPSSRPLQQESGAQFRAVRLAKRI